MRQTPDGGGAGAIRASDAERDATVERLRDAAGEGRLTLEEFSDRMEQASTARTRSELDQLLTDLPAAGVAAPAAKAVTTGAPTTATWHVAPIGGLNVSGPWRMGRHVVVISLIGGADLDLRQAELAARDVTLTKVSVIGGVSARVPNGIRVDASGLSLLGGTSVETAPDPGPGAPTIHIRAFSIIGGIRIRRASGRKFRGRGRDRQAQVDERLDRRDERRAWHDQRHEERRAWKDERRRGRRPGG
ncbi:MAG TPA: DUF1707 domain-containing protein [Streptosporangiaceae bacterium]|nr:DUF1707 domain-containing protein [Streptosporangiaceae bacterium]